MENNLFDFLQDENYRLMTDMARETHTQNDIEDICKRFLNADIDKLFEVCKEHELDGVAGCFALRNGLDIGEKWKEAYKKEGRRLDFLKEKSRELCCIMEQAGIPMVVLKNGGIMQDIMSEAIQCPMEDIDSLIRKKDFYKAHEILIQNGFTFKFRSEYEAEKLDEAYRDGSTEYYITTPDGEIMWFELAWRAVAGRWIRPDLEPNTDDLIEASHCAKDTFVHILSPEDNLLQVCIHTAKHSYVRAPGLRLHMDVDRIVSHNEIDWSLFIKKVNQTRVKTSTYISLYIPKIIFKTDVPDWVLDELRPKCEKKLLKMLGKVKLIHPQDRKFNKIGFLKFQTSLYDSKTDIFKVIYPGTEWIKERYDCENTWQVIVNTIKRSLDLVGIRKKK